MILHIDWETTGLPLKGVPSEHPGHPWPCSVSAILEDHDGRVWSELYTLIHVPREVQWEPKAFEANKLTHDLCERYGVTLLTAMTHLADMATAATTICAFNRFFDHKILKIGSARIADQALGATFRSIFESKRGLCTMEASARHFIGPDARFIKLVLAYEKAFGRRYEGAHGAQADNRAQRELYHWLKEKGCPDFADATNVDRPDPDAARKAQEENPGPTLDEISAGETRGFKTKPGKPGAIAF